MTKAYAGKQKAGKASAQVDAGAARTSVRRVNVPRAELVLSGNRVHSLLESLLAWANMRLAISAHALYVRDESGELEFVDAVGEQDRTATDALAQAYWNAETPAQPLQPWLVQELREVGAQENPRSLGLLLCRITQPLDDAARDMLGSGTRLLSQRLPGALELERLHRKVERLEQAERLQRALYKIADLANSDHDMDDVLAAIHGVVGELMYAENFFIALYDTARRSISLPYFCDTKDRETVVGTTLPISAWKNSLTLQVLHTGKAIMGPTDDLLYEYGLEFFGMGPQSETWLGVPMLRNGEAIGALVLQSYDSVHNYNKKDCELLNFVAQNVATVLDRLRAHEELERHVLERTEELKQANMALRAQVRERARSERLQASLFRIAELGSTADSLDAFYVELHKIIGELIHARNFYIALLSDDGKCLNFSYSADENNYMRESRELGAGVTEYVLRTGRPLLAKRTELEALEQKGELKVQGPMAAIWLGVPLIYDSHVLGVMAAQSYNDADTYSQRDQALLTFVSYHVANALQRKRQADFLREANAMLEERVRERTEELSSINKMLRQQVAERERAESRLRHAALHDALTGLPNRSFLMERMDDALARYQRNHEATFAVLFMDLDRFKIVNDSVGHLAGDELLKAATGRISNQLPPTSVLARQGGDEFVVLLEAGDIENYAPYIAQNIIKALEEPLRIAGKDIYSSASIGIVYVQPHYHTAEELLRDADLALYRAKANGRRRYEVFDGEQRRHAMLQLELDGSLRRALERREFEPVFQPIFDLESGKIRGFETLLRWQHSLYGLISPSEFMAQAEESGVVEDIDWQIFESAFSQAQPLLGDHGYLSINVGARHLRMAQFVDDLLFKLDEAGFDPAQLCIEVTESALLEDPEKSRELMERLSGYGITVALDDFGTGYSSLSYLHKFPLQVIKIDRSFIAPLDSDTPGNSHTVMRAIHALGEELGLEVIAEGIETESQLEHVKALGNISGQGFLLGRPASVRNLLSAGLCVKKRNTSQYALSE